MLIRARDARNMDMYDRTVGEKMLLKDKKLADLQFEIEHPGFTKTESGIILMKERDKE